MTAPWRDCRELLKFARRHRLKICTVADLIQYRRTREKLVERIETVKLPTDYGDFDLHLYRSKVDGQHHLALVNGTVAGAKRTCWCACIASVSPGMCSARGAAIAGRSCIRP